jgi:hypothetical protein
MGFKNEIHSETAIEGTADEVWRVLSDFASYPEWNPGMEQVQGDAKVGTRLHIRFRLNGGRVMTMKPTVLVAEPGRELRWLGRLLMPGIFDGEHRFEIDETAPGRVRFVQGERFKGLMVPFLRKLIEVDTAATFTNVNAALAARVIELRVAGAA